MLWCDKYRPKKLSHLSCHRSLNESLSRILQASSSDTSLPHLLLYGPSGAGKRTRIRALLREIYHIDPSTHLKLQTKEIQCTASKKITITVLQSPHHIEVSPSDSGVYDRFVVGNLVKEIAQSVPLSFGTKGAKEDTPDKLSAKQQFKIIVLNEVDQLTHQAQAALRRTMEKYMKTCRMILCASSTSKVIAPVKSRCLCLRVPLASSQEVQQVLLHVAHEECVQLPDQLAQRIADVSEGNLRRAIMLLESVCAREQKKLSEHTKIEQYHWDLYLRQMAKDIAAQQSPKRLLEMRDKLFKLTTNCIPSDLIMQKLVEYLIAESGEMAQGNFKHSILHSGALYEHRMKSGSRPLFHIEAFIARYMSAVKTLQVSQGM
uniref:AAA+ ATPase domain-containing protein n=1 Tax=Percolomonas cosmopolitus TaxID=63605 RepID=A0A7S1KSQ2_9EUKA